MALARQTCVNHPERAAVGFCVVTGKAVCPECSTRRDGKNYSLEGLEILRARREDEERRAARGGRWRVWAGYLWFPAGWVALGLAYWFLAALVLRYLKLLEGME